MKLPVTRCITGRGATAGRVVTQRLLATRAARCACKLAGGSVDGGIGYQRASSLFRFIQCFDFLAAHCLAVAADLRGQRSQGMFLDLPFPSRQMNRTSYSKELRPMGEFQVPLAECSTGERQTCAGIVSMRRCAIADEV